VLRCWRRRGLIVGQAAWPIDATNVEANAGDALDCATRTTGGATTSFLTGLAQAFGASKRRRAEDLAGLDRKRPRSARRTKEWKSPVDEDARIAKMKDVARTLAPRAEPRPRRSGLGRGGGP